MTSYTKYLYEAKFIKVGVFGMAEWMFYLIHNLDKEFGAKFFNFTSLHTFFIKNHFIRNLYPSHKKMRNFLGFSQIFKKLFREILCIFDFILREFGPF